MALNIPKSAFVAVIGIVLALYYMATNTFSTPEQKPSRPVSEKPFENALAGIGIVEAHEESVRVMPYDSGQVANVFVKEGDKVTTGTPLYQLDNQRLNTQLLSQQSEVSALQASLNRLNHEPRPETIPALEAKEKATKARYLNEKSQFDRLNNVSDPRAISQNDLTQSKLKTEEALANWQEAKANLTLQNSGAWQFDIEENQAKLDSARNKLQTLRIQYQQSVIKSPIDGTVLQVNTRPGEFVVAGQPGNSLGAKEDAPVIIGADGPLQVRVDIDEVTATYFQPSDKAMAYIKGNAKFKFPLQFKRIEPYMVPKRSLTGSTAERVDVRVLQVIYEFERPDEFPVYVGQQVEVFTQKGLNSQKTDSDNQSVDDELNQEQLALESITQEQD